MKLKLNVLAIILCSLCMSFSNAQGDDKNTTVPRTTLGVSVQVYPAGIIPTLNLEDYISDRDSFVYRLGGNFTDRQDFSDVNDLEEGEGFGGSFGYRRHFPLKKGKIIAGFNVDLWNLWIDWEDNLDTPTPTSGTTYIFVIQPWLEAGYFFNIGTSSQLGFTAGFGREINTITNGDEVAQDFIGSLSVQYHISL